MGLYHQNSPGTGLHSVVALVSALELFIGDRRAGATFYSPEGRGPIGRMGSQSENPLTRLVNTTPRHALPIGLYRSVADFRGLLWLDE